MTRLLLLAVASAALGVQATAGVSHARDARQTIWIASKSGAVLDSDLLKGGGTDDTAALQSVLERAADGRPVHLIIDGAALVRGLNVHGGTTIECLKGAGLYLQDRSNRAIVRNAHRSRDAITDEHITVRGCFLNGNRFNQQSAAILRPDFPEDVQRELLPDSNKEPDGTYMASTQFFGVKDLVLEDLTLWNVRAFGAFIANGERITIRNVTVDHGGGPQAKPRDVVMTDGFHFKGPLRNVNINDVRFRVGDDALAFNADDYETDDVAGRNDFGPYVRSGPITDVTVDGVHFMETLHGIRLLSTSHRIDRILISNVTGIVRATPILKMTHWMNRASLGNFGSIQLSNVSVESRRDPKDPSSITGSSREAETRAQLTRANKEWWKTLENEVGENSLYIINGHVESLILKNLTTRISDGRPVLRFGPDAHVHTMSAELSLRDPEGIATPVRIEDGARVDRLSLSLDWMGPKSDQGRNPIISRGGRIEELRWIDTPPLYAGGVLLEDGTISVTFTQDVKAVDFKAGVKVKVNGKNAAIARAIRDAERSDVIRYALPGPLPSGADVTWSYDAVEGAIQNLSGQPLIAIAEKPIAKLAPAFSDDDTSPR